MCHLILLAASWSEQKSVSFSFGEKRKKFKCEEILWLFILLLAMKFY
jgi:hypothetical protein